MFPSEIIFNVVEFLNRDDLDRITLVNSYLKQIINRYFSCAPYRLIHSFSYLPYYFESCVIDAENYYAKHKRFTHFEINGTLKQVLPYLTSKCVRFEHANLFVSSTSERREIEKEELSIMKSLKHIWNNAVNCKIIFGEYSNEFAENGVADTIFRLALPETMSTKNNFLNNNITIKFLYSNATFSFIKYLYALWNRSVILEFEGNSSPNIYLEAVDCAYHMGNVRIVFSYLTQKEYFLQLLKSRIMNTPSLPALRR